MDVGRAADAMTNAYQSQQTGRKKEINNPREAREKERTAALEEARTAIKSTGVTKSEAYGNTIGEPQLSEKAAKYYESLKEKFGDMDFVLVANDSVDGAEQKAAGMNTNKTIVLIDAEKIEKMAEDESYRDKYEGIIKNAQSELDEVAKQLGSMSGIESFGIKVDDDGKASFFAISKKNNDAVNEKMAQKRADKKEAAKKDAKKAEQKAREEKLKEKQIAKRSEGKERMDKLKGKDDSDRFNPDDYEIIEADSIEELVKKVQDHEFNFRSDNVMTEQESMVGSMFDFSL